MTKLYLFALAGSLILLGGCKSASKAYQKGDYTDAIELGVKKLQKDPSDHETRDLVQKSYNYTVNDHEDQIRTLSNSKDDTRFGKIYLEYVSLQHLYRTIKAYPAAAQLIKARDYSEYVETYREKAAEVHIERADKWLNQGNKEGFREAYKELNMALQYRPDHYELKKKRDEVYYQAITKVVIAPIQNYGGAAMGSQSQLQHFQRDVIRTLSQSMNNDFVKFFTEYELRNKNLEADQVMELNLSRISLGQPNDNRNTREVSREVVIKEIVYKPDSVVKQYGTVKAKITTTKRTLLSQGDLFITVRDTRGLTIWNDRFTGEHKWQAEFASYTGDERALSDSDKSQLNQDNYNPPSQDKIMEELLRQIQNDLSQRLRGYYARNRY